VAPHGGRPNVSLPVPVSQRRKVHLKGAEQGLTESLRLGLSRGHRTAFKLAFKILDPLPLSYRSLAVSIHGRLWLQPTGAFARAKYAPSAKFSRSLIEQLQGCVYDLMHLDYGMEVHRVNF
jgi:hypothetical protein